MRVAKVMAGLLAGASVVGATHAATPFLGDHRRETPGAVTASAKPSTSLPTSEAETISSDVGLNHQVGQKDPSIQNVNGKRSSGVDRHPVAPSDGGNCVPTAANGEQGHTVFALRAADALEAVKTEPNSVPDSSGVPGSGGVPGYGGAPGSGGGGGDHGGFSGPGQTGGSDPTPLPNGGNPGGGSASDDHPVRHPGVSGGDGAPSAGAVSEPAAWALMFIGFGGLGAALRRRRASVLLKST